MGNANHCLRVQIAEQFIKPLKDIVIYYNTMPHFSQQYSSFSPYKINHSSIFLCKTTEKAVS